MDSRQSSIRGLAQARRVLVVDDQADAAELLGMLLSEQGYEVEVTFSAEAALQIALEFRPQVAILDLGLPGMDGYELAVHLRAAAHCSSCRLIALSGHCGPAERARSARAGFETLLAKPFDVDLLLLAIAEKAECAGLAAIS